MSAFKLWCFAPLFFTSAAISSQVIEVNDSYVFKILKPQSEKEFRNFKKTLIKDYARTYIPPKSPKNKPYNADELIEAFKKNEISATNNLKNKTIRIKEKALEIGLNGFGDGFIKAGSEFGYVMMAVDKGDKVIQQSSSGEYVDMICSIDSYKFHTVYLNECEPVTEIASKIARNRIEGITYNTPNTKEVAGILMMYKINEKLFNKSCIKAGSECLSAINKVIGQDELADKLKKYAKDKGIYEWVHSLPQANE